MDLFEELEEVDNEKPKNPQVDPMVEVVNDNNSLDNLLEYVEPIEEEKIDIV